MKSRFWLILGLAAIAVALGGSPGGAWSGRGVQPVSAQGVTVSLDTDISDGPCTHIDSERSVAIGDTLQVAVCIEGLLTGVAISSYHVVYDDTVILAPEVADTGLGVDDNPDANAGTTTWGVNLGDKVDCSNRTLAYPKGDRDPGTGPEHGDAFISCSNLSGPWPLGDTTDKGVLAIITFNALKEGTSSLTLALAVLGDSTVVEIGTCNPAVATEMACNGATVDVFKAGQVPTPGQATATPTGQAGGATPTPGQATAAPTGQAGGATPTSERAATASSEGGGSDWLLPTVIGIVVVVVVLAVLSLAFYRWRRGLAR